MNKRIYSTLIGMLICSLCWCALPTNGKYYKISNANYDGQVMSENYKNGRVVCTIGSTGKNYQQYWLYTSGKLQNVYTGKFIQSQSATSNVFQTSASGSAATFTETNDGHIKIKVGGNTLHCDAAKNVVKWEPEAEASHWTFTEVTLTESEIATARAEYEKFAQKEAEFNTTLASLRSADYSALSTIFADNACTELKSEYKSMSDADLKDAVVAAGLPEQIANIAVKVKNGWSDETDGSISSQFRVQDYKAYSIAGNWTGVTKATQFNDMNNPTGIYTTGRDVLFVFVDSDIPANTSLRLASCEENIVGLGMVNSYSGIELHKGINIIAAESDLREYWLMYSITSTSVKTTDVPSIKVHIEGGNVLGYINTQGKNEDECNAEYKKILLAANASALATGTDKCLLRLATKGNYGMCYWQIMTYNEIWSDASSNLLKNTSNVSFESEKWNRTWNNGFNIYKSIRFYDNVLMWEWGAMGIMKYVKDATKENPAYHVFGGDDYYPTYVNNLALTLMGTKGGNPYSSGSYTHMPGVAAVESSYNAERADFDTWCVGHESGHNNQGTINLPSSMESSNNYFSNIITYLHGYRLSRGWTFMDNIESYISNKTIFSHRDISITLRMYFNLYLYYHRAGKKMDFSTTLHKLLRNDGMTFGGNGWYEGPEGGANRGNAINSWIKFYEKACDAAQEDLTEYFRMWGFFIPCNDAYFGDYSSYYISLTQKDIDAAIKRVKAKGYPENKSIIFIEDRLKPVERIDPWATPGALRPENNGAAISAQKMKEKYGDLGHFTDYMEGNIVNATDYTYTVSGKTIKMTGEGGVGILVYDKDGNIVYYSNKLTFNLPADIALTDFTIKVINADQSEVEAVNQTGTEQYREALQNAISDAAAYTSISDATGTKAGYYSPEQLATLESLVEQGNTVLSNNTESDYLALYRSITEEILRIQAEEEVLKVASNGLYIIQSNRDTNRFMSGSSTLTAATNKNDQQQHWAFIPADAKGSYYIQNVKTHKFMAANISENKATSWNVNADTKSSAGTFKLENAGKGSFFIKANDVEKGNTYLNLDGADHSKVAVWSADEGSKWNIVRVSEITEYTNDEINELVEKTNDLVNTVCDYNFKTTWFDNVGGNNLLQTTDKTAPYYVSSNVSDVAKGLDNALDGNNNTDFSTVGTSRNAMRFVTIDLGEGNEISSFRFYYRTSANIFNLKPTKITVLAGKTTSSLKTITTLTGLPDNTTSYQSYQSDPIEVSQPTRVWRLRVEANNNSNSGNYPDIAISRLRFGNYAVGITLKDGYSGLDEELIKNAKNEATTVTSALKNETTPLTNYDLYTSLDKAYQALLDGASKETGISEVSNERTDAVKGIFDMTGRRLNSINKSGLYIIDGKKVMVK